MPEPSPLWPARLHHLSYTTERLDAMARFYEDCLGMKARPLDKGLTLLEGGERRLLLGGGGSGLAFSAFAVASRDQLDRLRAHLQAQGINTAPPPTPLFAEGAFALHDPDGRGVVFGLPATQTGPDDEPPGRLQHVVVATAQLGKMAAFYAETLGFLVSDWVREESGAATACFFRSDEEHHSIAILRAPEARPDHHAYDVASWNDIRDWADHFAAHGIPVWWGPGRHGVGNNLFFMVEDPDGNKVEISSELEIVPREVAPREWPHGERAFNLWGNAWMRS